MAEAASKAGAAGGEHDGVNVQVLLRCRALSDKELAERSPQVISCNEALREVTLFQSTAGKQMSRTFRFDKVFGPEAPQEKLFKQAIVPIVDEVLDGFNCTIFAYGQTGTGKTYTMEGGPRQSDDGKKLSAEAGVIPRSIKQIFDHLEASDSDSTVKVSFMELYNEEVTDLLSFEEARDTTAFNGSSSSSTLADGKARLRLLEDRGGVVVQGLEEMIVRSATEIYQVLDRGTAKRRTAETNLNKRSSRSHSVFTITIHMKETTPEGEDVVKVGKLNLVDLAGSENISRSGAKDGRAREAGSINQSLLTLGRVITALVEHSGHIPYRDSKLTRLLRDSLGGRTKTCIIATIAPTVQCSEETISTLDYAHRAKNIRNRPEVNQKISKTTMIKELATEIEKLKLDLIATREKNGVYLSTERFDQGELERAQLRESVRALKSEIELEEGNHTVAAAALATAHAAVVAGLQTVVSQKEGQVNEALDKLTDANVALQERDFVISAQRRAEQALAVHGTELAVELQAASHDLTAAITHVDRLTCLHVADRTALHTLQSTMTQRLTNLHTLTASSLVGQAQHLAAASDEASALAVRKQADASALQQLNTSVSVHVATLTALVSEQLRGGLENVACVHEKMGGEGEAFVGAARAAAAAAHAATSQALEALAAALQRQAASVTQAAEQQATAAAAAAASLHADVQAAAARLASMRSSTATLQQSLADSFSASRDRLQAMLAERDATEQTQRAELLAQIGNLVGAFAVQQRTTLHGSVSAVAQQLQQDGAQASESLQQLLSQNDSARDAGSSTHQAQAARAQHDTAGAAAAALRAATELHSCGAAGAALVQDAGAVLEEHNALLLSHHSSTSALLASQQEALSACSGPILTTLAIWQGTASGLQSDIAVQLAAQQQADQASLTALSAASLAAAEACTHLGQGHTSGIMETGREMTATVQACVTVPGPGTLAPCAVLVVPAANAVQVLMCPSEEVLMSQYRRERTSKLSRRGGDARWAAENGSAVEELRSNTPHAATAPPSRDLPLRSSTQENDSPPDHENTPHGVKQHAFGGSGSSNNLMESLSALQPLQEASANKAAALTAQQQQGQSRRKIPTGPYV